MKTERTIYPHRAVWRNAKLIHRAEGGDLEHWQRPFCCMTVFRGEGFSFAQQGVTARGEGIARSPRCTGVEPSRIDTVACAIESHSFSAGRPDEYRGCICKMPIAWTPSVLAASLGVSIPQAVWLTSV